MSIRALRHPSPYLRFEVKVVQGPDGFHPFLMGIRANGEDDLLPIESVPPMRTYQDAEELALVVMWQKLSNCTDLKGKPLNPLD